MDAVFLAIESTSLSIWLRESPSLWVFPFALILHTWGLAFLVGANVVLDVHILGLIPGVPLPSLERYFLVMWVGFWVNLASGLALLIAYPHEGADQSALLREAGVRRRRLRDRTAHSPPSARHAGHTRGQSGGATPPALIRLAAFSLAAWAAAIPAGRFTGLYLHAPDGGRPVLNDVLLVLQRSFISAARRMMREARWAWPIAESLHFMGMSVLVGVVGLFDLRLHRVRAQRARGGVSSPDSARRGRASPSTPITGFCFLAGTPDQYPLQPGVPLQGAVLHHRGA